MRDEGPRVARRACRPDQIEGDEVLCILPRLEHGHTERAVVGALALAAAVVSAVAHALGADAAARAREHVLGDEVVVVAAKDRWIPAARASRRRWETHRSCNGTLRVESSPYLSIVSCAQEIRSN
eukprot:6177751-Pleurochrysis_carterae.AAC.5